MANRYIIKINTKYLNQIFTFKRDLLTIFNYNKFYFSYFTRIFLLTSNELYITIDCNYMVQFIFITLFIGV